jgi:hypothetical protein
MLPGGSGPPGGFFVRAANLQFAMLNEQFEMMFEIATPRSARSALHIANLSLQIAN